MSRTLRSTASTRGKSTSVTRDLTKSATTGAVLNGHAVKTLMEGEPDGDVNHLFLIKNFKPD